VQLAILNLDKFHDRLLVGHQGNDKLAWAARDFTGVVILNN
jgi:hypothetical protein